MMSTPPRATRILVIEDDRDTREFYEDLLKLEEYHVLSTSTGHEALAHVAREVVQGIVLDRRLPDFDGVQLCRLLRQRVEPHVPIILVTADRDPLLEANAREAGITDFLLKPFHPTDLINRLRHFMA
jgi:DNA-binding response OmpR family regulator